MSKNTTTNERITALENRIVELETLLAEARQPREQKSHRKYEVLALLKEGPHSTSELAQKLDTTKNNIGSLLTYLRKQDNIVLHMDHMRRHYIAG